MAHVLVLVYVKILRKFVLVWDCLTVDISCDALTEAVNVIGVKGEGGTRN